MSKINPKFNRDKFKEDDQKPFRNRKRFQNQNDDISDEPWTDEWTVTGKRENLRISQMAKRIFKNSFFSKTAWSCKICGDEEKLSPPVRYWDPDDGWTVGRLCPYCKKTELKRKPNPSDYAYDEHAKDYVTDEDAAIDEIYG